MMRKNLAWLVSLITVLFLSLISCGRSTETPATQDESIVYTAAAQTIRAEYTQSAGQTAVALLTQIAVKPTETPPPTLTPFPSATLYLSTSAPPTSTPIPRYCDWAEFVGDVTVEDNTAFPLGANFTKTWRLRNIGSCTWTQSYSLVFVGGDRMGDTTAITLPRVVGPGESVDVSVDLTAPEEPGLYRGNWMLRNPSGDLFGIDPNTQGSIWVQIQVVQPTSPDKYSYDFASNYCLAQWRNESIRLNCPGTTDDPDGFVILLEYPNLESRREDELALWTRPSDANIGWIMGEYPAYEVEDGDYFRAEVGCLEESTQCEVEFYLDYRTSDGTVISLDSWEEEYDDRTTLVDVDLFWLEGKSINFILSVQNKGDFEDANAVWFVPHIENFGPRSELVLTWHQDGGPENTCDELRIYLVGDEKAEAQAISCIDDVQEIGWVDLTDEELDQVKKWVRRLAPFLAETFEPTKGEPLVTYLNFSGSGDEDAFSSDIKAILRLAERLFAKISKQ